MGMVFLIRKIMQTFLQHQLSPRHEMIVVYNPLFFSISAEIIVIVLCVHNVLTSVMCFKCVLWFDNKTFH